MSEKKQLHGGLPVANNVASGPPAISAGHLCDTPPLANGGIPCPTITLLFGLLTIPIQLDYSSNYQLARLWHTSNKILYIWTLLQKAMSDESYNLFYKCVNFKQA